MKHTNHTAETKRLNRNRFAYPVLGIAVLIAVASGAASAAPDSTSKLTTDVAVVACNSVAQDAILKNEAEAQAQRLAEQWGVEVSSIRLTASNHMIDYRYRVLDATKAGDLFKRQIKPQLIDQKTGKVLTVPATAKLGPLRNSNLPQTGRIYWMFFGNAGNLVKAGDEVTVVIGEFQVENLVVE